jgi:AcrR family transcriptional regulator
MSKKNLKVEQGEETAKQLVKTAREMFSQQGYANVSTTDIVQAAGVTRGALYHHFDGKQALFRAVVEAVQADIGAAILSAVETTADEWTQLIRGCEAFFRASLDPAIQQILLLDGPAVIGREEWRRIDEEATTHLLVAQLDHLVAIGQLRVPSTSALAHLLAGGMNEAVLVLASESDQEAALGDVMQTLTMMLDAFRVSEG